jgi:hypothetical protein
MLLKISDKALAIKEIPTRVKLVLAIFWDRETVTCKEIRRVLPVSRSTGFELANAFNALDPAYRMPKS